MRPKYLPTLGRTSERAAGAHAGAPTLHRALAACVLARAEAYTPKRTAVSLSDRSTAASPPTPPYASAECAKCGLNADGVANCCSAGGSWHGACGDGLEHTSQEGFSACKGIAPRGAEAPGEEHAWETGEEHAWELDHIPPPPPSKHGAHPALGRNATLEQQLKNALLSMQDPMVPPSTGEHGIRVSVQYRIFKVIKVDIGSGELSLKSGGALSGTTPVFNGTRKNGAA